MTAIDALELSEGDTVLVVGATGGVGSFAVQLAARAGATVVAPALPEDEEYLRGLGVTEVLPREGDLAVATSERYTYDFEGVSEVLDHILITKGIGKFTYQVVHVNAEFANQVSDHDPQVVDIKP